MSRSVSSPLFYLFSFFKGFLDGHESVPHRTHADTQRGVRQSSEGECEEEPVATIRCFPPLPLSPISLLRLLLLSLSLSLYSPISCSFFLHPLFIISPISSKQEIIQGRLFDSSNVSCTSRPLPLPLSPHPPLPRPGRPSSRS